MSKFIFVLEEVGCSHHVKLCSNDPSAESEVNLAGAGDNDASKPEEPKQECNF